MFSLDDGMRYWLFTEPTDMRKSFHMLSGIVNDRMSFDLRNGDVFIFINKNRNRIKLLRKEPGGRMHLREPGRRIQLKELHRQMHRKEPGGRMHRKEPGRRIHRI